MNAAIRNHIGSIERSSYPGLDSVLGTMVELANEGKQDPAIRDAAVNMTRNITADPRTGRANRRDYNAIANAIYKWIHNNIDYVRDPIGVEWVQSARKTIQRGYGDCDDHSILASALLGSLGVPTKFKVIKASRKDPDAWTHVYVLYKANGQWIPFDTTLHSHAGAEVPEHRIHGAKTVDMDGEEEMLGFDPVSIATLVSTGLSVGKQASQLIPKADNSHIKERSALRKAVVARGVEEENIKTATTGELKQMLTVINQHPDAVTEINTYGQIRPSWLAGKSKSNTLLYAGAGVVGLAAIGISIYAIT
ncbi:MAG: transglutaminase-like domain-containing protein [Bacteroidota bacterium]